MYYIKRVQSYIKKLCNSFLIPKKSDCMVEKISKSGDRWNLS